MTLSSNDPLRLLFLADQMGYSNGTTHGGTTYFVNVLPALKRCGIDLTVCFMQPRHPAADQLEKAGVSPIFLGRRKWDPRAFVDVLALVRERCIEVLHLASLKSMLFGRWTAQLTRARSVIHIHDTSPIPGAIRVLERMTAPCTDAAIVLTEAMRPWTERTFGIPAEQLTVLPNGIDIQPFRDVEPAARGRIRREFGIDEDVPLIVVAGRVVPEKGQDRMIQAMSSILRQVPRAMLCIVGEGSGRAACEELARGMGIVEHIRFVGYRSDIPQVLSAADVVAVPSLNEPFGYAALEGMASGRPVVGFRAGGLPEVVEDGRTGLLVTLDDEAALAAASARLLTDVRLARRFGKAGRSRASQFTLGSHVDRLLDVYTSLRAEIAGGRYPEHNSSAPPSQSTDDGVVSPPFEPR